MERKMERRFKQGDSVGKKEKSKKGERKDRKTSLLTD
jgi:hypothetical protein